MSSSQDSQPFHWRYTELDDRNFEIRGHTLFFTVVLFGIVILVTLLFLYTRWVCRFSHQVSFSSSLTPTPRTPHAPPLRPLPGESGLDPTAIDTLPVTLYRLMSPNLTAASENKSGGEGNECCICLGEFEDGDKVKILPGCQHSYHLEEEAYEEVEEEAPKDETEIQQLDRYVKNCAANSIKHNYITHSGVDVNSSGLLGLV
ncbi:hypothetical protein Ddye_030938 [Dipteronia dyeriana]|uniref:RING-type E3 ubiquitin transferase n=1 Tax=Dipteronia dyeriana TaxID=168575 RepID=A0AAD9THL1_9ROSI|nr:hypothetical protein Ddye_030938 [Dipteronia dyeriana]